MTKTTRMLGIAALAWMLAGCGGGGGGSGVASSGKLSLGVTDAPIDDADEVVVTFTAVELLDSNDSVRRRFDFPTPQSVDLLDFQGEAQHFLVGDAADGVDLPAGVYDRVRLIVADQANASCNAAQANPNPPSYIRIDGIRYPLIVPSGGSSGLKVQGPITIAAGERARYTVDFDLRKSIAERGATGCYNLRPVLRVVDNAEVGTLTGSVDPALLADVSCTSDADTGAGAAVYVYEGTVTPDDFDGLPAGTVGDAGPDPLTTALLTRVPLTGTLTDFTYTVGFLLSGTYTVALTCQAGSDAPPGSVEPSDNALVFLPPQTVDIVADEVTEASFVAAPAP